MITEPFDLLRKHAGRISVAFLGKPDRTRTDQDIAERAGGKHIASLWQVHGGACVSVHEATERNIQADAAATATPHLTLTVRSADCQTFVLYAPDRNCAAVAHAGWKGLLAGVLPETVRTLRETWGSDPAALLACAAPSLCTRCCEFTDPVRELPSIDARFFNGRLADLRAIAEDQLLRCGIRRENIERMPGCTRCDIDAYWSYRGGDRDAVLDGWCNVLTCTLLGLEGAPTTE